MNTYSPDNSAIIDATGKPWPVETPHPLPLPDGIDEGDFPNSPIASLNFTTGRRWTNCKYDDSTHWLARRPLPPVPKVKTQEEKDEEAFEQWWVANGRMAKCVSIWTAAIAYARGGAQ